MSFIYYLSVEVLKAELNKSAENNGNLIAVAEFPFSNNTTEDNNKLY